MKRSADVIGNALLTAAHERCVAMMLSQELEAKEAARKKAKFAAHLTLKNVSIRGWAITHSHMVFTGNAPGIRAVKSGGSIKADKTGVTIPWELDIPVMLGTSIF